MSIVYNILILLVVFVFMEFVAWFVHKYLMHGFLWVLHEDHHNQPKGFFQKNDWFFVIFALPSMLFLLFGAMAGFDYKSWIGLGILLYGMAYFIFHEVIIHKRFMALRKIIMKYLDTNFVKAAVKAHHAHHRTLTKEGATCFGMLAFPLKYYKEIRILK